MESIITNTQIFRHSLKVFVTLLGCFILSVGVAQKVPLHTNSGKAKKKFEEAQKSYGLYYFDMSINSLNAALAVDENFIEAYVLKAQIFMDEKNFPDAIPLLKRSIELDLKTEIPLTFLMLAESQLEEALLMEAINNLELFIAQEEVSDYAKNKADKLIELTVFRKTLMENPVVYHPINLGESLNSKYMEHSPTLTVDEQTLYFTRKLSMGNVGGREAMNEDLFVSHKDKNGKWLKALPLGSEINTPANEGASAISPDGKYLFFTSCERRDTKGSCDIYIATKSGDKWVKARNLGATINTRTWESQPTFAPDGRTLFFVKKVGPRGKTHKDIYVTSIQDNGQWAKAVPITLNSSGNEESPFTHPDGETFYFTSDFYPGMGGRDLFMSKIDANGVFGEPVNLGYPINSPKDEVSLSVAANGKNAYFASGMKGGYGGWDLYQFALPKDIQPVPVNFTTGIVYDAISLEPIGSKFEIIDLATGDIVVESFSDKQTGEFLVTIPTGKKYAVNVSKPGYLFYSANYSLEQGDDSSKVSFDIPLSPIRAGVSVVLNNVFFSFNSFDLEGVSKLELDKLVILLQSNPEMQIEIGGHTDNKGTAAYNQKLSESRAKSVYDYLLGQGIPENKISYKGYNFTVPVESNETAEGRAKNRRTEFKIIKVD
ncbi:MAG: outer membrane protein OmpA-like peptidoglycan-associated protein [Salibacteraceae bacterium]|jgi:outer membrane protein OmpA-like peptidoglycan-associated protein